MRGHLRKPPTSRGQNGNCVENGFLSLRPVSGAEWERCKKEKVILYGRAGKRRWKLSRVLELGLSGDGRLYRSLNSFPTDSIHSFFATLANYKLA